MVFFWGGGVFLQYRCDFSSFRYYFIYFDGLYLLFREPGQKFVDFVYLFSELALGLIDFYFCFLISVLFISSLIFLISFLLLTLGFVCSFFLLILLGVRLFISDFSYFFEEDLYSYELSSKNCFCYIL